MKEVKPFYEIELKALLTGGDYERLLRELPTKMKSVNEDSVHTIRYRPGDLRLRRSNKIFEFVTKEGDVTNLSRKEIKIELASLDALENFAQLFSILRFKPDPSWLKHKQEFECELNGFKYTVCLQHIENFAYILEVEFLSERDDSMIHEPNLKKIIKELGCEPIEPQDFSKKIREYIEVNKDV